MPNPARILRPINPFTLEPAGEYPLLEHPALKAAVAAARKAALAWRQVSVAQRVEWMRAGLQYFEANRAAIAEDITLQMGKPIRQSENELKGFFERAEYLLGAAEEVLAPESLPPKPGFIRRIEHVPLGVVLIIAPWNYPLLTAVNGVAAALLAGNAVILKHSSLTPAVGEHFARAFGRLGPCEDLLQAVLADHGDLGRLIAESGIDHVVFTGSVEGGRTVQQAASKRFIDCNLELGGKDGAYVAADADAAKAAADLVDGAMYNAGQSCCGIERVYVHESLYAEFLGRCEDLAAGYVLGNPQEHRTDMGPLASAKAAQDMLGQVEAAKARGARVVSGGQIKRIGKGTFFEPTLITGADNTMAVVREENFGPILPILSVRDDAEAVRLINDSPYGLTSAIYTSDVERADRFAAEADTGTVFMNRCDYLDPALPWTGVRDSGRGTTLSKYGFYSLTRRKAIHFRIA
ncbi:MAG TPA: aldehyde dehydrogenase family protein [Fibrobacteria bacterium]|nr:aldehyde dehydrogenase family protein [Fibrobacteria bacterium]